MTDDSAGASQAAHPIGLLTPYEIAFAEAGFEEALFEAIQREAESRETDTLHLDSFLLLEGAGEAVRKVVPDEAPPAALAQYRILLYHAFNYWRFGRRSYALHAAAARYLIEAKPTLGEWELTLPHPSLYVQLPRNLFWSGVDSEATPEPVDGFFVASARAEDPVGPPYGRLNLLLVLGVRPDRAGFSVIPFDTAVGPELQHAWSEETSREDGDEFENVLPGGELSTLYSLLTVAEVTKLFAWTMWYVDRHPEAIDPGWRREDGEEGRMRPSRLTFSRIALVGS